jgi:hypothetical protein
MINKIIIKNNKNGRKDGNLRAAFWLLACNFKRKSFLVHFFFFFFVSFVLIFENTQKQTNKKKKHTKTKGQKQKKNINGDTITLDISWMWGLFSLFGNGRTCFCASG